MCEAPRTVLAWHTGPHTGSPSSFTKVGKDCPQAQSCGKASSSICRGRLRDRLLCALRQPSLGALGIRRQQERGPWWMPILPRTLASLRAKGSLLTDACFSRLDRSPDVPPNSDKSNIHSLWGFYSGLRTCQVLNFISQQLVNYWALL